jgi:hypothetical protein
MSRHAWGAQRAKRLGDLLQHVVLQRGHAGLHRLRALAHALLHIRVVARSPRARAALAARAADATSMALRAPSCQSELLGKRLRAAGASTRAGERPRPAPRHHHAEDATRVAAHQTHMP